MLWSIENSDVLFSSAGCFSGDVRAGIFRLEVFFSSGIEPLKLNKFQKKGLFLSTRV